MERLAEADARWQVIKDVQEYYSDAYALGPHHFSLGLSELTGMGEGSSNNNIIKKERGPLSALIGDQLGSWKPRVLRQTAFSLASILAALCTSQPITIRYGMVCGAGEEAEQSNSMAQALALQVRIVLDQNAALFSDASSHNSRRQSNHPKTTLLILERKWDVVSALVTPWTYEAMLHDLFTLTHGHLTIPSTSEGVNLADASDAFWAAHRYASSYGHLGPAIQAMVAELKERSAMLSGTATNAHFSPTNPYLLGNKQQSVAEVRRFVSGLEEYQALARHSAKHVKLVEEARRVVERDGILELSELEQNMFDHDSLQSNNAKKHFDHLKQLLVSEQANGGSKNSRITQKRAKRLFLLYVLRYHRSPGFNATEVSGLGAALGFGDFGQFMQWLVEWAGPGSLGRLADRMTSLSQRGGPGLPPSIPKIPESVYTQYYPPLLDILEALGRDKLSPTRYPYASTPSSHTINNADSLAEELTIVFFVGGCSYAEAAFCQSYSLATNKPIVFGGTDVIGAEELLDDLEMISRKYPILNNTDQ